VNSEKSDCIILSATPYRETSCILRLFTRTRGLVHGIAKGARKGGKSSTPTPIDRGFLMEALVYYKPNRELHTLGGLHVTNFFTNIRADITKSAIRDIALELYLKTIPQSDPHPELFDLMADFLADIENSTKPEFLFPLLWRFICKYCLLTGFGIDTENYASCGIDDSLVRFIEYADADGNDGCVLPRRYQRNERLNITESLLQYCRYHFDIRGQFNSFEFVKFMC
jgi:DNA repair protein RecO (recombination protein O)